MIASTGFDYADHNTSSVVFVISATASTSMTSNGAWYLMLPAAAEETDPKRKIPFYRALFDQRFPAPHAPATHRPRAPKWAPAMGRVRIDRRAPVFAA